MLNRDAIPYITVDSWSSFWRVLSEYGNGAVLIIDPQQVPKDVTKYIKIDVTIKLPHYNRFLATIALPVHDRGKLVGFEALARIEMIQ